MFWTQELLKAINKDQPQLINDSKTPSGEPHIGSLRGVLIHDAIYKVLRDEGYNVRYTFGSDDYDPVDEIPKGQDEHFSKYLGMPLCNVPAPPGSEFSDMADHFISGFFKIFDTLGVEAEKYRMRDIYRSGQFNEAIEKILNNSDAIRGIYKKVSGSEKSDKWYPFQTICENCGRIGTTEVIDFDGKEVTYICHPNMVKWAQGCGHTGKMSPFDGNGKLPWKLEWVAKWMTWGITIEGAGMDHSTKGGSRDVSSSVLRNVFNKIPPLNIPYGFFLTDGAKMSSSKGIGATAREMSNFLPTEILRYLMLSTPPKRAINFSPTENFIVKLYNDFDGVRAGAFSGSEEKEAQKETYRISELDNSANYQIPGFSLIKNLIQLPHVDIYNEAKNIKGSELNTLELNRLEGRIKSAKFWLDNFAEEEDKFEVQNSLSDEILSKLDAENFGFIKQFREDLPKIDWKESLIQQQIFDSSRMVPTLPKTSFKAMYTLFLNKDKGPQVGNLLFYLGRELVIDRLNQVKVNDEAIWEGCCISQEEIITYIQENSEKISSSSFKLNTGNKYSAIEIQFSMHDGHNTLRRLFFDKILLYADASLIIDDIKNQTSLDITE